MKVVPLLLFTLGPAASVLCPVALAAAGDITPSSEIAALEKKLAAARDELAAAKTALAISKSETEAAETRARALARPDSQVDALRGQVRVLERDLQSATTALKRVAADKAAAETALFAANQQLVAAGKDAVPPRGPAAIASPAPTPVPDARLAELQSELADTRTRLAAAEKNMESRDAELARLRASLAAAEARPAVPANVTQELAELRAQSAHARELDARLRSLEEQKSADVKRLADAEQKLATTNAAMAVLAQERDALRAQAARATELESRLRQLESEKPAAPTGASDTGVSKEEFARIAAAKADAEGKLSTVLRSYTLLTRERDELRARVAELTAKAAGDQEKR